MILGLTLSLSGVVSALDLLTLPSVGGVRFPDPSLIRRAPSLLPSRAEGATRPSAAARSLASAGGWGLPLAIQNRSNTLAS